MKKIITCIGCPMGCQITAEREGSGPWQLSGFQCAVGERYANEELSHPMRTVTGLVRIEGSEQPLPVKTSTPIPKELVRDCAALLQHTAVTPPVSIGDIIIARVCDTESNIIATANHT